RDKRLIPEDGPDSSQQARERLAAWRAQPPFDRDDWWRERLAAQNLDEESLLAILAAAPEGLRRAVTDPPAWLVELDESYPGGTATQTDELVARASEAAIPYPEWVARDATGRF